MVWTRSERCSFSPMRNLCNSQWCKAGWPCFIVFVIPEYVWCLCGQPVLHDKVYDICQTIAPRKPHSMLQVALWNSLPQLETYFRVWKHIKKIRGYLLCERINVNVGVCQCRTSVIHHLPCYHFVQTFHEVHILAVLSSNFGSVNEKFDIVTQNFRITRKLGGWLSEQFSKWTSW